MSKSKWHNPPKKIFLYNEKGKKTSVYEDTYTSKTEIFRDAKSAYLENIRVYEYVLVKKPIKEFKARKPGSDQDG